MKKAVLVFALFAAIGLNAQQTHNLDWNLNAMTTPVDLTIDVGDTVIWTNTDGVQHTVTSDNGSTESFNGTLNPGATFSVTFTMVGSNPYHCIPHPSMTGTITVQAAPPACPDPSNLNVMNITNTTADISWTAGGSESEWEIEYGVSGFAQGSGTLINVTSSPASLVGLSDCTTYDVYVRAVCGAETSNWVGPQTFNTAVIAPTNLMASNITETTADISWTENGSATTWEIEYGIQGFVQGSGTIIPDNDGTLGETISGLTHTTQYDAYVRSLCTGQQSSWVGPVGFTTDTPAGVSESVFEGFSYYPNPVKNELSIKANHKIQHLVVYSILGQKLVDLRPGHFSAVLETASLKPGIYFLKVNIEGSTGTYRLLKD